MQLTFRIECPECNWGHKFRDAYVNEGWLKGKCHHCGNIFFWKIKVTGVQIEVDQNLPEGKPCKTLLEAQEEELP